MASGKTLERLQVLITADGSGLASGLNTAANKADQFGKKMSRLGGTLSRNVTAPIVGLGAVSVKAFADFDSAMNKSVAIMTDVSDVMRKDMSDAARQVGRTTTLSASEAAESYFFLASAGLDASQSIAALPQVAAFAQAGMFDMALATDLATDAQSALGLTSKDSEENLLGLARVTDVLVKANTLANASVEQFSTSLTNKAGAALKVVNKDIEEGVAVLAAFADQGVKGAEGGNALAIVMRDLQTKAIKNKEEFESLGVRVFDAAGNMNNMADIIGDLEGALEGMGAEQAKATLLQLGFSDKSVSFVQALLGSSEAIRGYEASLRDAGGTTQEVADKQLESFSAQMGLVKDNVIDVAIGIGEVLAPTVAKLAGFVGGLADKVRDINPTVLKWGLVIGGVAAAIGPVLLIVGQLSIAIGALLPVLAALTGPVGLVVAAVGLAGAAFFKWREEITGFISGALEPLKPIFAAIVDVFKSFGALVMEIAGPILKPLAQVLGVVLIGALQAFVQGLRMGAEALNVTLVPALKAVKVALDFMREAFGAARDFVAQVMAKIVDSVLGMVDKAFGAFERLTSFLPVLGDKVAAAGDGFRNWAAEGLAVKEAVAQVTEANEALAPSIDRTTEAVERQTVAFEKNGKAIKKVEFKLFELWTVGRAALGRLDNSLGELEFAFEDLETVAVGSSANINIKATSAFQKMADEVAANSGRVLNAVERVLKRLAGGSGFLGGLIGGAVGFLSGGPIGGALGFLGGLAEGGTMRPGQSAIVGEQGPEFITAGVTTTVTPMGDMTMRVDPSSIPPFPRLQTPNEAAVDAWWRQLFSEMVLDGKARGVLG